MYIRNRHIDGFIFREPAGNTTTTKPVAKSSDEYLPYQSLISKYSSSKYSSSNNNAEG